MSREIEACRAAGVAPYPERDGADAGNMSDSFTHRTIPVLGRAVHRLGLCCNYGLDAPGFEHALASGLDYVFWTSRGTSHLRAPLREALRRDRERLVIATGPTLGYFGGSVRRGAERMLRELGVDYIDVLQLFWVGVGSALSAGTLDALVRLKEQGKVRAIGISIHDRKRAAELVLGSPLDLFMLRYNAEHPGAERDIFPAFATRRPAVVAYTATSWRHLLRAPRGWDGPSMSAGDCYRFCLSSPHVDVTLTGVKTRAELEQNLRALELGPLSAEEDAWMRRFGAVVHGGRPLPDATSSSASAG